MAGVRRRTAIRAMLVVILVVFVDPIGAVQAKSSPSDRDVERARTAEEHARSAVAEIETRLAELNAAVDEARLRAALAAEAYNGARAGLAEAQRDEEAAVDRAAMSRNHRDEADVRLGRLAAAAYRSGAGWSELGVVINTATEAPILDVTDALAAVARSQARIHVQWADATAEAESAAEVAERLVVKRIAAQQAAEQALAQAQRAAHDHEQSAAAATATRDALVVDLAAARGTTAELEHERQRARARQAQHEREQAEVQRAQRQQAEHEQVELTGQEPTGQEPTEKGQPEREQGEQERRAGDAEPSTDDIERESAGPEDVSTDTAEPDKPSGPPFASAAAADRAISYAHAQLGKPYLWAGAGPASFDCSGLTMRAWEQGGVRLSHWSVAQARQTARVSFAELKPGDLIFWSADGAPSGTYHVALYIGSGKMIHAPSPGRHVETQDVFYWRAPSFYTRVVT